jgi:D-beta-D-heptose 7-phosphate kinase/D-beta-D-heptose 1-phosphate adenosyltransferase
MNVLILGDVMLDINKTSEIKRNAPEADIPIYNILDVNYILGGASNVALNLKNLKTNIEIISVIGDDISGDKIKELFDFNKIKYKLFVDKERKTTQKNRIFFNNKLYVRYDNESIHDISINIENEIISYITCKNDIDAIVISDYDKGLVTENLAQIIINYANENNILTFVDPKLKNYTKYRNCFLFKPNQFEAETISGEKNIDKILHFIKDKIGCKNILMTRGKEGMILNNIQNKIEHTSIINLVDVTGAGDVVLSVLVYCYLKEGDLLKACKCANFIAGKSVGVIGNYCISKTDIDEYNEIINGQNLVNNKILYDYEVDKIKNISKMHNNIVFTNGCFDILHSGHIKNLQFSKSKGDILVVGLNSDESIKRLKGSNRPINDINERSLMLSLLDFVDYIIIFSDDTPYNLLKNLRPDILVKGSDYNVENVVGSEFAKKVILFDYIDGRSTTNIIKKIKSLYIL